MTTPLLVPALVASSLVASSLSTSSTAAVPAPVPAAGGTAIRSVVVRPSDPVVGPAGSVRLVVDVVARGADRVSVVLEPGRAPSAGGEEPGGDEPGGEGPGGEEPGSGGPGKGEPGKGEPGGEDDPGDGPPPPFGDAVPMPGLSGLATAVPGIVGAARHGRAAGPVPAGGDSATGGDGATGGWETWRFLPDRPLSRWYPSGPWTVTATAVDARGGTAVARAVFHLRRATEIEGLKVARGRGGDDTRVTGTLLRVDPGGRVDYRPFPGQRVRISFRPAGSSEWRPVGEAVTRRDGWFSARTREDGQGAWRAEYAGSPRYAADVSSER
ncbi:hypothetical protein [Microbispora sp. H10885]|uniref:hypothetical protein n=2 Tax=Microbispora TaxID=2005 RepID=UPI001601006F|nr:hypothetical protein [Microbispora sp. H10885]